MAYRQNLLVTILQILYNGDSDDGDALKKEK